MTISRDPPILLTLGEAARRLQVEPDELHAMIQQGTLHFHTRDEQGRFWFEQGALNRLALVRGRAGKGIDDGRPQRRGSPPPMPSTRPEPDDS